MPTLLMEHTLFGAPRPPRPWTPTVLLSGGELRGLALDGVTPLLRTDTRGALGGHRAIAVARQADVSIKVDEPEDGVTRIRLWALP